MPTDNEGQNRLLSLLIVGSGLIGVSTAYFLAKAGHQVTVLDSRPGPGLDTSFANGGLLTPSMSDPWNAPGVQWKLLKWLGRDSAPILLRPRALPSLLGWGGNFLLNSRRAKHISHTRHNMRLANYSLKLLRQIRKETNMQYDGAAKGSLKIFRDIQSLEKSADFARQFATDGLDFSVLDAEGAIALEPSLGPIRGQIRGALFYPKDEVGDAHKYCQEMVRLSSEFGCKFKYLTEVHSLKIAAGAVTGVETSEGFFAADAVIMAAGPGSANLLRGTGIKLPIRPVKGYSLTLPKPKSHIAPSIPVIDDALHAAVTPIGERIRVAGTAEFAGQDRSIDKDRIKNLLHLFRSIYPAVAEDIELSDAKSWAGLRPVTATGIPIIGRTKIKNLLTNTGHGHLGWTQAIGSGKLLADIVAGVEPDIFPSGSPDRRNR